MQNLILNLQQQINTLEGRVKNLMQENTNLSDLSVRRLKEVDEMKSKYKNEMEGGLRKSQQIQRSSVVDVKEMALKFDSERDSLNHQILQLKQVIEFNKVEISKLKDINEQRKAEIQEIRQKVTIISEIKYLGG